MINEVTVLIISWHLFPILDETEESLAYQEGWSLIAVTVINLVANSVLMARQQI